MDAGFDYEPIYKQIHRMGQQSVIAYNKRNEPRSEGFDKYSRRLVSANTHTYMIVLFQNAKHSDTQVQRNVKNVL